MSRLVVMLFTLQQCLLSALAFRSMMARMGSRTTIRKFSVTYHKSTVSDRVEQTRKEMITTDKTRQELKGTIVQLGASYDRGFGASPRVRRKMEEILQELETLNPETNAARWIDGPPPTPASSFDSISIGINGDSFSGREEEESSTQSPLFGTWRMIWTTAQDVLILGANPLVTVGAIYQFIDPPIVTNVIDFMPRLQNLLPPSIGPNSMVRAEVATVASSRIHFPNRVGLSFQRVQFQGQELLGQDVSQLLPPLGFNLPRINVPDDVGYFDVTYLDAELLVIRQNSPGGCFVLVNVDRSDTDP